MNLFTLLFQDCFSIAYNLFICVIKPHKATQIGVEISDNYYIIFISNISFFYYKSLK